MTKPASFRDEIYPEKRCSLCRHYRATGHVTLGGVCLLGDRVDDSFSYLVRNGVDVEVQEGDELDAIWVECSIHEPDTSVCDSFELDDRSNK